MTIRMWCEIGRQELVAIHSDETGENNMSTVMILAIAAFVGAGIFMWGSSMWKWAQGLWDNMRGKSETELQST